MKPSDQNVSESLGSETNLKELLELGMAIYENKLKAILEPQFNGKFVAIHVDTGDYTVGRSSGDAMRTMHKLHPDSRLLVHKIGPEPEYGLAARILTSEMLAGRPK